MPGITTITCIPTNTETVSTSDTNASAGYGTILIRRWMSELFKALNNFKTVAKKHTVLVNGQEIEVSLQKKLEIIQNGADNYTIKDGLIISKPKRRPGVVYPVLKKTERGYWFHRGDIHWPEEIIEGGESWVIE